LTNLLGQIGSILRNPVDVSQGGTNPVTIQQAARLVLADPSIDLVLIQEDAGILLKYVSWELTQAINAVFVDLRAKQDKPIVIVSPPGGTETERLELEQQLSQASIPVFPTMERAARAIVNLRQYSRFQATASSQ
jgi:acyl-CoA synthetase (NDP forming)